MQNKRPLYLYVLGAAVVWAVILSLMWDLGHFVAFHKAVSVCAGFWIGMLAMYIAMHVYRWK